MPLEDQMLYQSHSRIKELEDALKAKDKEIKQIRKALYEELEPMVEKLFRKEFPDFKKALLDKGAPWIPDGLIELHSNDSEDID